MGTFVKWLGWALAAFMVMMGVMKFLPMSPPIFQIIEMNTGLGFVDPWFKYLTGILEILSGAMIAFVNRRAGTTLALAIIGGAILAHLTVLGISTPTGPELDSPKSPMLFLVALASFAVAAFVWLMANKAEPAPLST